MMRAGIVLIVLLVCGSGVRASNLALGTKCTITPKPNYKACSDSLDLVQVTDGILDDCKWYRSQTVGWARPLTVPEVTIDLGTVQDIGAVHIHTTGGGFSGVFFPEFIAVLVSRDGFNYTLVGARTAEHMREGEEAIRNPVKLLQTYRIEHIGEAGRYVKVILQPKGVYLFFDEIEVYGTKKGEHKSSGDRLVVSRSNTDKAVDHVEEVLRTERKAHEIRSWLASQFDADSNQYLCEARTDLEAALDTISGCSPVWSSVNARKEFCDRVCRIRGKLYSELHDGPLFVEAANPMCVVRDEEFFVSGGGRQELSVSMWQGEHESAALNVVNCSTDVMRVRASVSPLVGPDGRHIDSGDAIVLRRGVYGYVRSAGVIADALVLQGKDEFTLDPGDLTQLWFTIRNHGFDPGRYRGWCAIDRVSGGETKSDPTIIPINLDVVGLEFPSQPQLDSFVWAYTDQSVVTRNCLEQASSDLASHYTTACTIHALNAPFPKRNGIGLAGKLRHSLDFSRLDRAIDVNATYAKTYMLYLNFKPKTGDGGIFGQWMSPSWKQSYSEWLIELISHLKAKGIGYDRFLFYPFDETLCDEFLELAILTKSIDPNVRIFTNWVGDGVADCERFKNVIDVWCVWREYVETKPKVVTSILGWGKQVWVYDAAEPGRAQDPYEYYRLLPWIAFKHGLNGVGFWTYIDPGERAPWDDHDWSRGFFATVYGATATNLTLGGEQIVPSRRWEAWREGIEDHEKLCLVRNAISRLPAKGPFSKDEAKQNLDSLVEHVLRRPEDRSAVYEAQRKMDELLRRIKDVTGH